MFKLRMVPPATSVLAMNRTILEQNLNVPLNLLRDPDNPAIFIYDEANYILDIYNLDFITDDIGQDPNTPVRELINTCFQPNPGVKSAAPYSCQFPKVDTATRQISRLDEWVCPGEKSATFYLISC